MKMIKGLFLTLVLILPTISQGAERIRVKDEFETTVKISTSGLTHINVEGDRIVAVKASNTQFQLDKDEVLGHIYLQPEPNNNEPIQLFISTEKQHMLPLLLIPSDVKPSSITLILEEVHKVAALWEQSQPYEIVITNLIKAMHNQDVLEGYSVEAFNLKNKRSKGLEVLHLKSYKGKSLRGEILEVTNPKKTPIEIVENDFYKPGIRAVAISNKVIAPNSKTRVYLVRENG